uniref:Filamentous hemagglutinin N-terminal domain-containing protein n=1 Tax=Agrobacterium albertimagni TaxID=147266 RepID=A0A7C1SXR2_9HYPH
MTKRLKKLISSLLAGVLTFQPVILNAQDITLQRPDSGPRPHVDQSANGTTILNIATPNAAGVSHDIYTAFSAGDLILNNAATNVSTQLGGFIEGNPNLTPGKPANLWIGEVLGGSHTQLNGILEVAGKSMDVVLANEFGITCNGCGFVNTGRATLSTGKPVFDTSGTLQRFDVRQGMVTIGEAGLNPEGRLGLADTSRVDVIARAAILYGAMRAKGLNIVTGANQVAYDWAHDPQTGTTTGITEQPGTGPVPGLAVDVAALGGMYANAINLIATEDGVGVRLSGELASSTDIALSADGKLTLGAPTPDLTPQIRAREKITIKNQGPLLLEGAITSENGNLIDIRAKSGSLTFTGEASAGAITLEGAGPVAISGALKALHAFRASSTSDGLTIDASAQVSAGSIGLVAASDMTLAGKLSANNAVDISAGARLAMASTLTLAGGSIDLAAQGVNSDGTLSARERLQIIAGTDGLANKGTLSAGILDVGSARDIANSGILAASQTLTLTAKGSLTNAATLISGGQLAIHADQIRNNGGVIWANDTVTLAANANLDPASLIENANGRIEAFQGDLVIRADEVANLGTAPTIAQAEIKKWIERGTAAPFDPVTELSGLIDPAYLEANGTIKPAHAAAYTELFADLIHGGKTLSSASRGLLKADVLASSGTALKGELAGRWGALTGKANAAGTPDPAARTASLVKAGYRDASGNILPAHADAYAKLWVTLASGQTTVSDEVKAVVDPAMLVIESQTTNPLTGITTTVYSNSLKPEATAVWTAMLAGNSAAYDIVKILRQDSFKGDGKLAELVAGGTVDIKADTVSNIFGNVSAGDDILITADTVTNKALGASQVLLEVHKKPGCFTCHEGKVDFYDTFGGRMEAVGNVRIAGNLTNITLNSSELSMQEVMEEMNAFIAAEDARGDADLSGVPAVSSKNFHLADSRSDNQTAPEEGKGSDLRIIKPADTPTQTPVEVAPTITPTLSPTASLAALLAAGLNTIAETDPQFTRYANFITSNYMMEVDRLEYRDELVNNTSDAIRLALARSSVIADPGSLAWLDQPILVPAPDGSGLRTVLPRSARLELSDKGALIAGRNVTVSGSAIDNSGAIVASRDLSVTADTITGRGGSFTADAGVVALTALGRIELSDTAIDARTVDIVAGQDFLGKGVAISAATDASIFAATGVTLTALERSYSLNRPGSTLDITDQQLSSLTVGGDLSIVTAADLLLAGLDGDIGGRTLLSAGGDLLLTAVQSETDFRSGDPRNGTDIYRQTSHVTELSTGGDFIATSGGQALLIGTQINAGGRVELAAADGIVLAAAQDIYEFETRKSKKRFFGLSKSSSSQSITERTNRGVSIAAAGDIDVITEAGDLTTAGTRFVSASGDINLSAVEGDIYAGTYTDIFRNETKRSRSFLFGLISSSSARTTLDRFNTGTDALAALDLSLVSGADTTLVGANLSAGGKLTIDTGGDFSVKAAIDSQRLEFFSSKMGLVTMTTITEQSFVERAVFTKLLAGQGLSLTVGGEASLTLYQQAGVDQPTPEDLYPQELLALEGLKLLTQDLANDHFYDKQTQLSPAFKALVAVALSFTGVGAAAASALGATGAMATGITSFVNSAIVGSLDGLVSGNFDIGDILKDATFSGVSAGITGGIDIKFPVDHPFNDALINGFGTSRFTMAGLLNAGLDGVISSGLSSAVYGTDFGSGVLSSIVTYVANGVAGAGIEEIADRYGHSTFSVEKLVAKATINCLAAEATGASCASGAVGSLVTDFLTEYSSDTGNSFGATNPTEYRKRLELVAAIAGYFTSGGKGENVYATASAALLDYDNNCGPCVFIIPAIIGALTVADYALTAKDAYDLATEGLACDAGDQAACNRVAGMARQYAIETGITMTVGQVVPGDKIGMKLITWMRKHGDESVVKAVDDVVSRAGAADRPVWGSWNDYPKVTVGGSEYAQVGDRLYTHHAVDSMQPSGLGAPAGNVNPGRSIAPGYVEDVISQENYTTKTVNGELRRHYQSGSTLVVTSSDGGVVISINPYKFD